MRAAAAAIASACGTSARPAAVRTNPVGARSNSGLAEGGFEGAYPPAHRRRIDVQRRAGAGERAVARDEQEILQPIPIHGLQNMQDSAASLSLQMARNMVCGSANISWETRTCDRSTITSSAAPAAAPARATSSTPTAAACRRRSRSATPALLDRAVAAAKKAQPAWAATNPQRRARVMFEFKRLVEANMDEPRAHAVERAWQGDRRSGRATSSAGSKSSNSAAASRMC